MSKNSPFSKGGQRGILPRSGEGEIEGEGEGEILPSPPRVPFRVLGKEGVGRNRQVSSN